MSKTSSDPTIELASFVDVLRARALHQPERRAFTFLTDGQREGASLTAGALDRQARALGARLEAMGLAGERALLLFPPGLEFHAGFFGCLYAGVVAVPATLPRPNRSLSKLRVIVADARPKVILTVRRHHEESHRWSTEIPELADLPCLAIDDVDDCWAQAWRDPRVGRDTLAFLQYTSGSTAAPKGVMVSHGNLLHNSAVIRRAFGATPESRGVFWLPLYHDMGLIGGVLQTLYCGGTSTLLSPVAFLQRPVRWLEAITRTRATISGGPNFAYDLCARKITPEQKAGLDLSRWSVAFNGAEPIRPETLERFAQAFEPCGFRREAFLPCYGLAESTLLVSGSPAAAPVIFAARPEALGQGRVEPAAASARPAHLVGNGRIADGLEVAIMDPQSLARLPGQRVGEIWLAGPSVAHGYWNQPEATAHTFHARIAGTGEGPFLRTGDLGFLADGELFVTGRLKDLVIIRGRNVYPQDIEATVRQSHALLRSEGGAAFSVEVDGEERLVVLHEVDRLGSDARVDEIFTAIRTAVAEQHELELHAIVLLKPMSLPKTSSGKLQRHVCKESFLAGTLDAVATASASAVRAARTGTNSLDACDLNRPPAARAIADWLTARLADHLKVAAAEIDPRRPFSSFGVGSLQAVALAGELEQWLGHAVSPTLVYEHPTIADLASFLGQDASPVAEIVAAPESPVSAGSNAPDLDEPIAIIGIGCRFPGASGPDEFWTLLREGRDAVGEVPLGRPAAPACDDSDQAVTGVFNTRRAGFLDRIDGFDADFFGMAPREATCVDPQQRLLLEVAWEALEDAGLAPERLAGTPVGVFIGISTNDYGRLQGTGAGSSDAYLLTGNAASIAANRLSYVFDLRGPSVAIDTACSSSLVAVHLACRSLQSGEASLALAGGVNLMLAPEVEATFAKAGFLAPDGRCKAFDASADGYVRGEGCGVVVLKPRARALADGDPIYAVIRGSAINQDGRTNGLTAPSRLAQEAVLRAAYLRAGVAPGRIAYVEAHGTGTFLGDPIEAKALGTVLAEGRAADSPCAIGSAKTNIGHLEAAAGVAGLIKVALALTHGVIPPSLHFREPNPHIPFGELPLRVQREPGVWPAGDRPALAGVSAFGFGGTNAHVVLEAGDPRPELALPHAERPGSSTLLPISARGPEALDALARSYRDLLANEGSDSCFHDIAYSAGARRGHHDHRVAVVARSRAGVVEVLDAFLRGEPHADLVSGRALPGRGESPDEALCRALEGDQVGRQSSIDGLRTPPAPPSQGGENRGGLGVLASPLTKGGPRGVLREAMLAGQAKIVGPLEERDGLLRALGIRYTQGHTIAWDRVYPTGRFVRLPRYPWQRARYWFAAGQEERSAGGADLRPLAPDLPTSRSAGRDGPIRGTIGRIQTAAMPLVTPEALPDECLYELDWQLSEPTASGPVHGRTVNGLWVIFADAQGVGPRLRSFLETLGATCITVTVGGAFRRSEGGFYQLDPACADEWRMLADDVLASGQRCRGVVYLWGLDSAPADRSTIADIESAHALGCGSVLGLVRALFRAQGSASLARLWIVTRGALCVVGEPRVPDLSQAPLWGLGRSLPLEHPKLDVGLLDLDPESSAEVASDALASALRSPCAEDQLACRTGRWYVARVVRKTIAQRSAPLMLRADGTYMITGGLGDLGLRTARWVVERGARRLVLIGRAGLPPRASWDRVDSADPARARIDAIRDLERQGATVVVAAVDVADEVAMSALFARLREMLPVLRGVVHAAGVLLPASDPESLATVLRPKVAGTWVLHKLTLALPLDFFVAFSSIAAIWGAKEASYAAANQFLEVFAHYRRGLGLPALSIAWGPWAGAGMASLADRGRAFALVGLRPLAPQRAFHALEQLLGAGAAQAAAVDVDWTKFKAVYEQDGRRASLELVEDRPRSRSLAPHRNGHALGGRKSPPERRRTELVDYLRDRVAGVLGLDPERLDADRPLDTLGLDSLMALELKSGAEADLGASIPLAVLFEARSIVELADLVLARLDDAAPAPGPASAPVQADSVAEHPPALGQQSLWALQQITPDSAAYNVAGAARIRAELDLEVLRQSFQKLVDRHAALRTTFATRDGKPVQRVHARQVVSFQVHDAAGSSEAQVAVRLAEEARRPFDLEAGPLFRAQVFRRAGDDHYLLLAVHHSVSDFWSVAVLMDELGRLYPAAKAGVAAGLAPLTLEYTDFARWQAELLASPDGERLWSYWREQLAGPPPVLSLATDRPRPAAGSYRGATKTLRLQPILTRSLQELGRSHGASLYVTLLAAFQALLARESGQVDIVVGSPVAGRNRPELAGVVGYFVNPLPMRARVEAGTTFAELLIQVRNTVLEGLEHQDFPFPLMVERIQPARDASRSPLFQVMFVFQKAQRLDQQGLSPFALRGDGPRMDLGGFPLESVALDLKVAQFDLTLMAAEAGGCVVASLEYNTDLFDSATVDRLLAHFRTLLEGVVASPRRSVAELPIMSEAERRQVLAAGNGARADFPRDLCIHRLIEKQVAETPDAVAVAFDERTLTYRELNVRANRLARRLRALGVEPESRVGLCVERSPEMVVGVLGILKAGGAYVPIDPEYPRERVAMLLEDAGVAVLVTQAWLRPSLPRDSCHALSAILDLDEAAALDPQAGDEDDVDLPASAGPENLAYVIYTSGSTGKPKGVQVTHHNLVHSTFARRLYYREPVSAFLLLSSFAFDSSVAGLFWTLCEGGTLVLPRPAAATDPSALAELIAQRGVSHLLCVPSLYGLLLAERRARALASLRAVIVAGEVCPRELGDRHFRDLPTAALYNEYGPTEATVWCSVHRCRPVERGAAVPIGRPIANARIHVLDPRMRLLPLGVTGELYVGGPGVARGYLDRPSVTAERFVPDPFGGDPGARLYRTGDLARWRSDGEIDFLGRADHQVKVRGYRIEPEEVEAALGRHPLVREAAVVAREDSPGEARLVAYVVPAAVPAGAPAAAELRRWLRSSLPEYMVPSVFVTLSALPAGPNGKVDRNALPAPDRELAAPAEAYAPPRNAAEESLASIVAGVLGRERVGIHDNLFDLGIDSIRGIQIASRLRQAGLVVTPAQLFQLPTVAELAGVAHAGPVGDVAPATEELAGTGGDIEDAYPLSPVQQGMLFHSLVDPDSGVYVQQFTCTLHGALDAARFARSVAHVVGRHPVLRTAIETADWDRPLQRVHRHVELPLDERDWRQASVREQDRRLREFIRADRERGFVPSVAPLMRLALIWTADDVHHLLWSNHHLLMDGWCLPLLFKEVLTAYEAYGRGADPALPACRPYREYITWLTGRDHARAEAFWRAALLGFECPTPLGIDRGGAAARAIGPSAQRELELSANLTTALKTLARGHQLTLNTLVQGAWALLLSRYSGRDDVVFGATVSGRPADLAGVETMVGLFINTLPVRVALPGAKRLLDWLKELQNAQVELRQHEFSPLVEVQSYSDVPRGQPLFESILVFENYPMDLALGDQCAGLRFDTVRILERTNYPLTVVALPGEQLALRVVFDTDRFEAAAIERLLGHIRTVLEGMVADPFRRLADIPLLTAGERRQLRQWNSASNDGFCPANGVVAPIAADLDQLTDREVEALFARICPPEEATCHE